MKKQIIASLIALSSIASFSDAAVAQRYPRGGTPEGQAPESAEDWLQEQINEAHQKQATDTGHSLREAARRMREEQARHESLANKEGDGNVNAPNGTEPSPTWEDERRFREMQVTSELLESKTLRSAYQ